MPIRPENRNRYPADWRAISLAVKESQGWRCAGIPAFPDCHAKHGEEHPDTGSRVVLTTAHLNHNPEDNRAENLRALCQRCHLAYDLDEHRRQAATTRANKLRAAGQQTFIEG